MLAEHVLVPVMGAALLAALICGYPVAYTLGGVSILFALVGMAAGVIEPSMLAAMPLRIVGIMGNFSLLAIPAFVFMGAMLEKSGIAERLLESMGRLLGRVRGGLALAVVLVGTLLAATTGVVAATVTTMGLIALPSMLRAGYDRSLASGVIVAAGTLGQMIPPSIVLVVLGDQLGISVGDLFMGSVVPGLLMAGAFAAYVLVISRLMPELAPPLAAAGEARISAGELVSVVVPPLLLILLVLGSIFFGIATPTEAGVIGGLGAMLMAAGRRRVQPPGPDGGVRRHAAHLRHGDGDPARLQRLQPGVPGSGRGSDHRRPAGQHRRRPGGLSDREHGDDLRPRLLHRFL